MTIGPSIVSISGFTNFQEEFLDLDFNFDRCVFFLINNFWTDSISGGSATGSMELNGPFDTLVIRAEGIIDGLQYNNISLSSFEFSGKLNNLNEFNDGIYRS